MSTPIRYGRQTPTFSFSIPYTKTFGKEAIDFYNKTKRKARPWQELLVYDILAVGDDGLFVHTKNGYEVPRRNGKGEILSIVEMWGVMNGLRVMHTAHRVETSHSAWERTFQLLTESNGSEPDVIRQKGAEQIKINGGVINYRTRSAKGGLGEGYDILIIDEAQEYTIDQESALKYVVSDSANPLTLFCGTPPTAVSSGTVFMKMRDQVKAGLSRNTMWAEWSVEFMTDPHDVEAWYETNPSLGYQLSERKIEDEITSDDIDFNIQRLGLWLKYNQKSEISKKEWEALSVDTLPKLVGKIHVGIKYGHSGENVALSIACKTTDDFIFVESIDCQKIKNGNTWLIEFLSSADIERIVVDGANGQQLLLDDLKEFGMNRLKSKIILPTVKEVINVNTVFERDLAAKKIKHANQPALTQSVTNCEKRAIGNNGGFGYRANKEGVEIALMDSMLLAYWSCATKKKRSGQRSSY